MKIFGNASGNAGAAVRNDEFEFSLALLDSQGDAASRRCEPDGVAEQIQEQLSNTIAIDQCRHLRFRYLDVQTYLATLYQAAARPADLQQEFSHVVG
ncbi:MAG: hypothetical protein U5K38_09285 [Woeseiaceae bacterium]|nr:hypothetical protein [Woeseiaceae bacterium]